MVADATVHRGLGETGGGVRSQELDECARTDDFNDRSSDLSTTGIRPLTTTAEWRT